MDRTQRSRDLLRTMLHTTGLTHRRFGQLVGRSQKTVNLHANTGTIPASVAEWLERVAEIRIDRHADAIQATIVISLPFEARKLVEPRA
jgi:hypothetical protein